MLPQQDIKAVAYMAVVRSADAKEASKSAAGWRCSFAATTPSTRPSCWVC